ncbi:MAG: LuxR C-terminal-related transcriptional regulator [Bernardetiaceae bacterium]|nr:LuxR C-terminal-related transcriptional regulator [Bernardetiaceae bacterium]
MLAEPAWGLVWWVQGAGCLAQVRLVRQTAVTLRIILVLPGPDLYTAAQVMDVSGILDCTSATDELVTCLAEVAQGNYYLSRHLAVGSAPSPEPKVADQLTRLSLAQLRVLAKVADGLEAAEIADCLCLATDTVKHHKAAIMARLGLASQPFLYFFAERHRKTIQAETNRRLPSKS